jgi:glycerol kinase
MLEGIAFLMKDIFETLKSAGLSRTGLFRAGGGLSHVDALLQFQADLFQAPIERPPMVEATALGAAFLAGLGCEVWSHPQQILEVVKRGRIFWPRISKKESKNLHQQWKRVIRLALQWSAP